MKAVYNTYKTSINLNGTSIGNAMESAPFEFFEPVLEDVTSTNASEQSSGNFTDKNDKREEPSEANKINESELQIPEKGGNTNGELQSKESSHPLPIKNTVPKYKINPLSYNFKLPEGLHKLNISVSSSASFDSSSADTESICLWLNVL